MVNNKPASVILTGEGMRMIDYFGSPPGNPELEEVNRFDFFYLMKFQITPELTKIVQDTKQLINRPDARWEDLNELHITLVYVHDATAEQIAELSVAIEGIQPVPLMVDSFGTFSTDKGGSSNVLFLKPVMTPELRQLQRQLYGLAEAYQLDISQYSEPADWNPHITLAYFDEPFNAGLALSGAIMLPPIAITASVDYNVLSTSNPS